MGLDLALIDTEDPVTDAHLSAFSRTGLGRHTRTRHRWDALSEERGGDQCYEASASFSSDSNEDVQVSSSNGAQTKVDLCRIRQG